MKVRILSEHHIRVSASKSVGYRPSKEPITVPKAHGDELIKHKAAELVGDAATKAETGKES